ncbi:MAG: DEAD/DEAH box helicase [Spirochaetia bacterium]|nr:DEAD/DEAH box helicase [Spirochaetia bacterium]
MKKIKFSELNLSAEVMKGVEEMGFEEATHIQTEAIPAMMKGTDIIGQAQTGTGKTAAFGIPILEMIDAGDRAVQALILCPTRELAVQVAEEIRNIGRYKKGITVLAVYGGQPIDRQIQVLRRGAQVIIGTPGRLMDHMERRTISLAKAKIVVMDEADEMLNMGFIEDVELILKQAPAERQTVLFSATMPGPILALTKKYQKEPKLIKITHEVLTAPSIEQSYYELKRGTKVDALCRLLDLNSFKSVLVFCNTKMMVDELTTKMYSRGYTAEALHGDKSQAQRDRVMDKFRNARIDMLIATDVAARGIDVDNIDAVFNYDVPQDEEDYVHRIGRTGRAGKSGKAYTFVYGNEMHKLREIMKYARVKIKPEMVPAQSVIEEKKSGLFLDKIKEVLAAGKLEEQVSAVEKLMEQDYSSVEIAAALMKMVVGGKQGREEAATEDLNAPVRRPGHEMTGNMVRLFVSTGRQDRVGVKEILKAITLKTGIKGALIGRIDLFDKYSFVQIDSSAADNVVLKMNNARINGIKIHVERAKI